MNLDPLTVIHSDALTALADLEPDSAMTCVTSPPYWGLRAYGTEALVWDNHNGCAHEWGVSSAQLTRRSSSDASTLRKWKNGGRREEIEIPVSAASSFCQCGAWRGELGTEPTPELYVKHLVDIFRELRRVLRAEGTVWLNLGDSYWGGKGQSSQAWSTAHLDRETLQKPQHQIAGMGETRPQDGKHDSIKPKDLVGIPWMVAFALRADGWYLRSDIVWSKPNPMPESVTDRPTKSHEYLFLLSKSPHYYYNGDAIKEPITESSILRISEPNFANQKGGPKDYATAGINRHRSARKSLDNFAEHHDGMRNKRTVWEITTQGFTDAHFATFPTDLITPCILAGSSPGGVVVDPFAGSGTTGKVAIELGRKAILIEPKSEYIAMIERRCRTTIGLPLQ